MQDKEKETMDIDTVKFIEIVGGVSLKAYQKEIIIVARQNGKSNRDAEETLKALEEQFRKAQEEPREKPSVSMRNFVNSKYKNKGARR